MCGGTAPHALIHRAARNRFRPFFCHGGLELLHVWPHAAPLCCNTCVAAEPPHGTVIATQPGYYPQGVCMSHCPFAFCTGRGWCIQGQLPHLARPTSRSSWPHRLVSWGDPITACCLAGDCCKELPYVTRVRQSSCWRALDWDHANARDERWVDDGGRVWALLRRECSAHCGMPAAGVRARPGGWALKVRAAAPAACVPLPLLPHVHGTGAA